MVGDIAAALRARRQCGAPQRPMILDAVRSADSHRTAEEIRAKIGVSFPYSNLTTVDRLLDWRRRGRRRRHLVCLRCGRGPQPMCGIRWRRRCASAITSRPGWITSPFSAPATAAKAGQARSRGYPIRDSIGVLECERVARRHGHGWARSGAMDGGVV